ncbi:MAG: hypothetical protein WCP28_17465 [Actinomycetes bacterium]
MSIMEPGLTGFEPVTEVAADDRARVALTKAGVHATDRFLISIRSTGEILLTPVTSIPKREMVVWQDEALRASLQLGIAEAEAGLAAPDPSILTRLDAR